MSSFERIVRAYADSPVGPVASASQQHKLYGLYKQATQGDVDVDQPGIFNVDDQRKYQAWRALRGLSKQEAQQRFVDLARELGYRDPGDCPVPWISDETWRREESWPAPDHDDRSPCIQDPRPLAVRDIDRQLAPTLALPNAGPISPRSSVDEHRKQLRNSPQTLAFHIYSPQWPICCERAATLVGFRGIDEAAKPMVPKVHILEAYSDEQWARGDADPPDDPEASEYGQELLVDDLALYHCLDCGCLYLARHEA